MLLTDGKGGTVLKGYTDTVYKYGECDAKHQASIEFYNRMREHVVLQ